MASWFCRIAWVPLPLIALGEVVAGCATRSQPLDPMDFVGAQIARGEKTILVPKAVYGIDTDKSAYFDLSGLDGVTECSVNLLLYCSSNITDTVI